MKKKILIWKKENNQLKEENLKLKSSLYYANNMLECHIKKSKNYLICVQEICENINKEFGLMKEALKKGVTVDNLDELFDNTNNNNMTKLLYGKCPISGISELDREKLIDIMSFEMWVYNASRDSNFRCC